MDTSFHPHFLKTIPDDCQLVSQSTEVPENGGCVGFEKIGSDRTGKHVFRKVKILTGICTAQGYRPRRDAVRDTWLRHSQEGVECLFFLGGELPEGEEGDTVALDVPDAYDGLPSKVLAFFRYALKYYDFEWLYKCDDDTYVDLSRLPELADAHYGIIGDVSLSQRDAPSGGAGYMLSHEIVQKISSRSDVPLTGAEDLVFGKLALEEGAVPLSTPRLFMANVRYPAPDNDMVSAHWCSPDTLYALDVFRHGRPTAVYRGRHNHWEDQLVFYREGVFRRVGALDYGWWDLSDNLLTLNWKQWDAMAMGWKGGVFKCDSLKLERENGARSLWELTAMNAWIDKKEFVS